MTHPAPPSAPLREELAALLWTRRHQYASYRDRLQSSETERRWCEQRIREADALLRLIGSWKN